MSPDETARQGAALLDALEALDEASNRLDAARYACRVAGFALLDEILAARETVDGAAAEVLAELKRRGFSLDRVR